MRHDARTVRETVPQALRGSSRRQLNDNSVRFDNPKVQGINLDYCNHYDVSTDSQVGHRRNAPLPSCHEPCTSFGTILGLSHPPDVSIQKRGLDPHAALFSELMCLATSLCYVRV